VSASSAASRPITTRSSGCTHRWNVFSDLEHVVVIDALDPIGGRLCTGLRGGLGSFDAAGAEDESF
jgi:hypothetical protein